MAKAYIMFTHYRDADELVKLPGVNGRDFHAVSLPATIPSEVLTDARNDEWAGTLSWIADVENDAVTTFETACITMGYKLRLDMDNGTQDGT